ncbi:jg10488 [Pararge aegeria aegeria]|uniref:Jg10488 protein n=1 Tax=Pararge aegeria aegeria TaxID=348720 RepID=A0A8S4REE9_9NEOP|nr:jg10488 [Pararge aegeria aegeria]
MKIKLTTEQPVHRQPYRLSRSEQSIVKSKVDELLDAGIIKESESSYASLVILVKKKNGDSRLCVDYRALNAVTLKERYPLPNIDDQVSKLAGKRYFTSLDLAQSYHQVRISPEDTHKTAFVTPQGHYEYTRVPFGLANAASVFMRLINKIVESAGKTQHLSQNEILAFLDVLLLPSIDIKTGLQMLKNMLSQFATENLKLNLNKCSFLQTQITYMGHETSSDGIQPSVAKLEAVSQFPVPSNVHDVRRFIGLCSYFRKCIFKPLNRLDEKEHVLGMANRTK